MYPLQYQMVETELSDIVGRDHVMTAEADRLIYGVDYFWLPRMLVDRGQTPPLPDFVVLPGNVDELAAVVRLANLHQIPIIPWGGGSGSQGGIVPVYGGITVDLKRLNRMINIDTKSQTVTAQAGIGGYELECALNAQGYTLPHYPASVHSATLGGYLSARGTGTISTKYGKAEDMVLSIQVVLPNGDVMRTLPVPNHASGPGILQLFVGAEGSYGIITEATMRIERLPDVRRFRSFLFPDIQAGLEAGRRIMLDRLQPLVIRLYDEPSTIKTVRRVLGTEVDHGAYMVMGFDGQRELVDVQEKLAFAICAEYKAEDLGEELGRQWWEHRYDFYFPPKTLDLPWMFGTLDTVCTYDKLEPLYWGKKKALEERYKAWDIFYYAHFSHWFPWGAMIYDRFIIENPPADPDEALALHTEIWDEAIKATLEYGAVLNEHHGVGLKMARHVRKQFGTGFQVLEGLKQALDPHNIMNPGKMGFGPVKRG
jgi:alkyldihydroxyacetonephosphate synthase